MTRGERTNPLAHRRLLGQPLVDEPFAGTDLLPRLGGQATVDRLVDLLYDGFAGDAALRPLFGRDLIGGRANQKGFFAQWLGGSKQYGEQSYSGLVHRHESVPITPAVAERWLYLFQHALTQTVADDNDRKAILEHASALALALVNEADTPAVPDTQAVPGAIVRSGPPRRRAIASCGKSARVLAAGVRLAQRGDTTGCARRSTRRPACSALPSRPPDASRCLGGAGRSCAAAARAWR
jgi:truncated hemoglobin YjbI